MAQYRCVICILKELEGELSAACSSPTSNRKLIRLLQMAIRNWTRRIEKEKKVIKKFHICSPAHNEEAKKMLLYRRQLLEESISKLKKSIKSAEKLRADQVIKALDYALTFGVDTELARIESARINQFERLLHCRKITLNRMLKKAGRKEIV